MEIPSTCPFGKLSPSSFRRLSLTPHHSVSPTTRCPKAENKCLGLLLKANDFFSDRIYPPSMVPLLQTDIEKPCLFVWGHSLFLITSKRKEMIDIVPPIYTDLKLVSHIPLSIFLMVVPVVYPSRTSAPSNEITLDEETIAQLIAYYDTIKDIRPVLYQLFSDPELLKRQQDLVELCYEFIDTITVRTKQISYEQLLEFTANTTTILKSNLRTATRALIDSMHSRMMIWKESLTQHEWDNMRVVVAGSNSARNMELHMQYFAKLLGTSMESDRVMYAEQASTLNDLVKLLGIHTADFSIGEAFFGNKDFMRHDIQAFECAEYLREIFPYKPPVETQSATQHPTTDMVFDIPPPQ